VHAACTNFGCWGGPPWSIGNDVLFARALPHTFAFWALHHSTAILLHCPLLSTNLSHPPRPRLHIFILIFINIFLQTIDTISTLPDVHTSKVNVVPAHTDLSNMSSQTSQQVDDAARDVKNNVQQGARDLKNNTQSGSRNLDNKADDLANDLRSGAKDFEKK
jgi:gas vesicle protein